MSKANWKITQLNSTIEKGFSTYLTNWGPVPFEGVKTSYGYFVFEMPGKGGIVKSLCKLVLARKCKLVLVLGAFCSSAFY